jgi:hypothetical protein
LIVSTAKYRISGFSELTVFLASYDAIFPSERVPEITLRLNSGRNFRLLNPQKKLAN